jgi:hypothetical protein
MHIYLNIVHNSVASLAEQLKKIENMQTIKSTGQAPNIVLPTKVENAKIAVFKDTNGVEHLTLLINEHIINLCSIVWLIADKELEDFSKITLPSNPLQELGD